MLVSLLWLGLQAAPAPAGPGPALDGARCRAAVERQLRAWSAALDRPYPDPAGPFGQRILRWPTDTLGVWVRLTVDGTGDPRVERVTAGAVDALRFTPGCEAEPAFHRERAVPEEDFTDRALADLVGAGGTGVILLWSPHMPLSVDAYGELEAASRSMGIALAAVLDPAADLAYAIESFVHAPDPELFFAQCRTLVRPGGMLVLCDDFARPTTDDGAERAVGRFRRGWHVNALLQADALQAMARDAGFAHVSTEDLSPYLELRRLRDRVIRAVLPLAERLPIDPGRFDHVSGGSALQECLERGWVGYDLVRFERTRD